MFDRTHWEAIKTLTAQARNYSLEYGPTSMKAVESVGWKAGCLRPCYLSNHSGTVRINLFPREQPARCSALRRPLVNTCPPQIKQCLESDIVHLHDVIVPLAAFGDNGSREGRVKARDIYLTEQPCELRGQSNKARGGCASLAPTTSGKTHDHSRPKVPECFELDHLPCITRARHPLSLRGFSERTT